MKHSQEHLPRQGVDAAQLWLIIMVILAFIASIIMLISGSPTALRLALLAALWAAALGFLLVNRYKKTADSTRVQLFEQRRRMRVETERVEAERETDRLRIERELRSSLEAEYQKRRASDVAALRAIRREVSRLRSTLESLGANDLAASEALHEVESKTLLEIESRHSAARQVMEQNLQDEEARKATEEKTRKAAQEEARRLSEEKRRTGEEEEARKAQQPEARHNSSMSTQHPFVSQTSGEQSADTYSSRAVGQQGTHHSQQTSQQEQPSRKTSQNKATPFQRSTQRSDAIFTHWTPSSSAFNSGLSSDSRSQSGSSFGVSHSKSANAFTTPSTSDWSQQSSSSDSVSSSTSDSSSSSFGTSDHFATPGTSTQFRFSHQPDLFATSADVTPRTSRSSDFTDFGDISVPSNSAASQDEESDFSKLWENAAKNPPRTEVRVEQVSSEPVRKHRRPTTEQLRKADIEKAQKGRRRRDKQASGVSVEELMRRGKKS